MTQVFKPSLENANLLLLEVLIRRLLSCDNEHDRIEATNDLANFMDNKTSEEN